MKKNTKRNRGFSMIEVIVAIFVFAVGITAVMSLISKEIFLLRSVDDRLTAIYLAQEGIEIIRNIRDENWINGSATRDWRTDGNGACNLPPEINIPALATCVDVEADPSQFNSATGEFLNTFIADYRSFLVADVSAQGLPFYYCPGDRSNANFGGSNRLGYVYDPNGCAGERTTDFLRELRIQKISDDEMQIRSIVRWGSPQRFFEVTEIIKDWNKQTGL